MSRGFLQSNFYGEDTLIIAFTTDRGQDSREKIYKASSHYSERFRELGNNIYHVENLELIVNVVGWSADYNQRIKDINLGTTSGF